MKRSFYLNALSVLICSATISCTKVGAGEEENFDAIDQNDDVLSVITISKPTGNPVYTSGDSIIVEGKVTDDKKMYKGKVQINNDANNLVVADYYYETHFLQTINYHLAYKAEVTASTEGPILCPQQLK